MFHFDDDLEKYMVEIDGVAFACEEPREDYEEAARKLARLYGEKQQALAEFLLPELQEIFEGVTAGKAHYRSERLPDPVFRPDPGQRAYHPMRVRRRF